MHSPYLLKNEYINELINIVSRFLLINQNIIIDTFLFMLIKFIMFSILFIGLMYFGGMNQYEKELMGKPFYIFCKKNKNCPHL